MKARIRWRIVRRLGTLLAAAMVGSIAITTPATVTGRDQDEAAAQKLPTAADAIDTAQALEQAREAGLTDLEAAVLQEWVEKEIADPETLVVQA